MELFFDSKGGDSMIEAVRTRRSVRKFTARDVEQGVILQLLESARLAPSGHNTQPWRFIVVRSPEAKRALAKAAHGQSWMEAAPVFIVCVADIRCRIHPKFPSFYTYAGDFTPMHS
jgi:nitroreductase